MGFIPREELEWEALKQPLSRSGFIPREELEARELKRPLGENVEPNYKLRGDVRLNYNL